MTFSSGPLACSFADAKENLGVLKAAIERKNAEGRCFLVGNAISAADFAVYGALYAMGSDNFNLEKDAQNALFRWFDFIGVMPEMKTGIATLPSDISLGKKSSGAKKESKSGEAKQTKDEGKFVDLPGAEKGKVIVRFPPEASG